MHRFCKLIYGNRGDCHDCDGTKKCQSCNGSGEHPSLRGCKCPSCDGTGVCFYSPNFKKVIGQN